jgi:filamentous hemagglutinin family protein
MAQLRRPRTPRSTLTAGTALVLSLSGLASFAAPSIALAAGASLPQGGTVVVGSATISQPNASNLNIATSTQSTAINWQSFSIGTGNTVTINQPNAASRSFNEVTGGDPSAIYGSLKSNGQVILANPNGIWFAPGSQVNVASIVASTATASQAALAAFAAGGTLQLDVPGNAGASIVNEGTISVADEGLAALVAPGVANNGVIAARLGQVVLASGTTATLDFYGDGLISFAVGGSVTALTVDHTGHALSAAVVNAGTISASGGTVLLTAAAAKAVVDNTINMSGVIEANAVSQNGGEIDLQGGSGTTNVSGTLTATAPQGTGGTINISGQTVQFTPTASLSAGTITISPETGLARGVDTASINGTLFTAISSPEQLSLISEAPGGNYDLTSDIDLSSTPNWTPIGTSGTPFTGTFDGLGHTISNLTTSTSGQIGLFGAIGTGGVVENLGITGSSQSISGQIGLLAGSNNGTITNTYSTDGSWLVGSNSGTVTNSYSIGGGGLVGSNSGTITESYSDGIVGSGGGSIVGGLVDSNSGSITNTYATGIVTTGGSYSGGLYLCPDSLSGCGGSSYGQGQFIAVAGPPVVNSGTGAPIVLLGTGTITLTAISLPFSSGSPNSSSPSVPVSQPSFTAPNLTPPESPLALRAASLSLPGSVTNPRVPDPASGSPGLYAPSTTLAAPMPTSALSGPPLDPTLTPTDYANQYLSNLLTGQGASNP